MGKGAQHQVDWGKMEDRLGLNLASLLLSPGFSEGLREGVVWTGLLGESRFGRRLRKGVREGASLRLSCDHTGSMLPAASAVVRVRAGQSLTGHCMAILVFSMV